MLRESVNSNNYNTKKKCSCPCNIHSLRPYICCLGTIIYTSSCIFSFYVGHIYEKTHCNTTLFEEL